MLSHFTELTIVSVRAAERKRGMKHGRLHKCSLNDEPLPKPGGDAPWQLDGRAMQEVLEMKPIVRCQRLSSGRQHGEDLSYPRQGFAVRPDAVAVTVAAGRRATATRWPCFIAFYPPYPAFVSRCRESRRRTYLQVRHPDLDLEERRLSTGPQRRAAEDGFPGAFGSIASLFRAGGESSAQAGGARG